MEEHAASLVSRRRIWVEAAGVNAGIIRIRMGGRNPFGRMSHHVGPDVILPSP